MKKYILKICSVLLTITIIISSLPLSAVSLTAKQQEDFYRVNTWWQDAENKEFIDWILESDNFLYHLDITEGDIIHDMSYAGLNLNAKERKDNFVEILTSFIGLSYDEIREVSAGEALSDMSMEFLNGFEDYLEATELYTVEQFEYMTEAIKETSEYYLLYYYGIDTDMGAYGYEAIYQRIQNAFDNRVQNFDFPDRKAETMDAFYDFVSSSEWLNKLSSVSEIFSLVGEGLNIAQDGFALLGEVESYEKTDERLVEFLKYIRSRTTDSALRAACDEIIEKFDNTYTENIVAGVSELLHEGIVDLAIDTAREMIVSKCGIYNLFAQIGITAGNVVSDIWFNTTETKNQMQTIYCLNALSELIIPLLNNELEDLFSYNEISTFKAEYAADAIYHMSVLVELRKLGEESYYKLKDSVYSSNIIATCKTLGWVSLANDEEIIEAWYSEFTSVMESVKGWLFKTIPANYYYVEQEPDEFEIEGSKLIAYNGGATNLFLPDMHELYYRVIAENAFADNETIDSIHIPYSVDKIESYAFNNCPNLKSITFYNAPEVVIEENAFYNCHSELTIYGEEGSTAQEYAIANNITFVSLYSEYDDAQNFTDPDFVIEDGVLVDYLGDDVDVYIPYGVAEIGERAFEYDRITSVVIPDSVTYISTAAFQECKNLTSIAIPDSVTYIGDSVFLYCENLTSITLPDSVFYIGEATFWGCSSLVSIELPNSIPTISQCTFKECVSLTSVTMPKNVSTICAQAFEGCEGLTSIIIPDGVREIEHSAFWNCKNLKSITIPNSMEVIGSWAFAHCESLDTITIPENVLNIAEDAFADCYSLKQINVDDNNTEYSSENGVLFNKDKTTLISYPDGKVNTFYELPQTVTHIFSEAFNDCQNIERVVLPNSVETIGDYAFCRCISLASVTLPDGVERIGYRAFGYCVSLSSITIPNSVTEIGGSAFSGCSNLVSIELPSNITEIDSYTFFECISLTSVTIPNCVERIGYSAFAYCESLNSITIPNSVTEIGECVFWDCDNLISITIPDSVTSIGEDAFGGCGLTLIKIPDSVIYIGEDAFADCYSLKRIDVDSDNTKFASENGVLFNKNKTDIIKYPEGNTDTNYNIPNSVTKIGISAFYECRNLVSIMIPDSVTIIYYKAFYECEKLSYVFYSGTQSQWENIIIDEDNSCLTDAIIHFNSVDHTYGEWEIVTDFTCESSGLKKANCIICGYETSAIISAAHSYDTTVIEPSCTQDGSKTYNCSVCGKVYEETLPAVHTWSSEWTVDSSATCTSVGSKSHHCLYCNEKIDVTEIPMISHTWSNEWTIDLSATCTIAGSKSHHCLYCDEKTDITEIPASHTWSTEWTIDIEPTETTEGSKSHHCLYCDEKTDITVIPKLDAESPTTDFKYTIKNGEVTIDKYIGTTEVMSIPSHIDGYPVTTIKSFAFSNNATIQKAIIPYTVKDLNYYAFYNCTELLEVKIGNGITTISENCFSNCSKLQKVSLPENLITIKDGAFYYCESLTEITLPNTVEVIEEKAFYKCTTLTNINIPDVTYEIGENAFYGTPWLENLTGDCVILGSGILMRFANEFGEDIIIPEGVQTIYDGAFEETYVDVVYIPSTMKNWIMSSTFTVSAFVVDAENPYLCVYEEILYNAEKTHLLSAPSKLTGTIILPSTVVCIEDNAFYSSNLSEIVLNEGLLEIGENAFYFAEAKINIPNTVVTIGDSAFSYCYGITDVVIPQSVTSIDSWAFNGCSNLKSIRFLSMDCDIYDYSSTIPSTAIIYGCPTSTAYFYAEEYNREFVSIHNIVNGVCSVCNCSGQIVFVEDNKHIEGVTAETNTVTQLQSLININGRYIEIYSCGGTELLDDNLVGTGSVVKIYDTATNELITSYTIVLYGDISGDGLIEDADYSIIALITCNTTTLENQWMLMACDVNKDGTVDGFDAIELDLYLNDCVEEISGNQTVEETVANNTQTEALIVKNEDEEELL